MFVNPPHTLPPYTPLAGEEASLLITHDRVSGCMRPLHIAILNLMPLKEVTETDFMRMLAVSPLPIHLQFMRLRTHTPKHTSAEHLDRYYRYFDELQAEGIDGLIVTGAPIELLPFEEVTYWKELQEIFNWAEQYIPSTLYICWGAQAALYHFFNIPKYPLNKKLFGIFAQEIAPAYRSMPIFNGFGDTFDAPHSRNTETRRSDIEQEERLHLLAYSEASDVHMAMTENGKSFFITGHAEYAPDTLHNEYIRDVNKGLPIDLPQRYYPNDDPTQYPMVTWRETAQLFFTNWLHYYVYLCIHPSILLKA